jgi:hypothetical protein
MSERNAGQFGLRSRLPRKSQGTFTFLLLLLLRHGTDSFTSSPKEGMLWIFSSEKSDGFGRVRNRDSWVPLDQRSRQCPS